MGFMGEMLRTLGCRAALMLEKSEENDLGAHSGRNLKRWMGRIIKDLNSRQRSSELMQKTNGGGRCFGTM